MTGFSKEIPWPQMPCAGARNGRRACAERPAAAPIRGINPKGERRWARPIEAGPSVAGGRAAAKGREPAERGPRAAKPRESGANGSGPVIRPTPRWPTEAAEALVRLWRQGLSTPEIAARLGMTTRAIDSKVRKLRVAGIDLPRRMDERGARTAFAQRRCLHCGQMFASSHIGNRLCPTCLEEGPFTSTIL